MFRLFVPTSTLDKLKDKYATLMRRSFETALYDKGKSDLLNEKACIILEEIRRMEKSGNC